MPHGRQTGGKADGAFGNALPPLRAGYLPICPDADIVVAMKESTAPNDAAERREPVVADPIGLLAVMARDFADSRDIEQTLHRALTRITDCLQAEAGALFLLDERGETLTCTASVGATDITGLRLDSDQGIVGRAVQTNRGELVRNVREDPAFFGGVDAKTGFTTKSIICAPMSVRNERIGAIELVNRRGRNPHFAAGDLHVLETMATSAALAILNAHLAEALVEQERVRRELELAAEIQRSLLPRPEAAEFPIHGLNLPAGAVSGDFYDFFTLPDGRICFNLGDVSGKGMNAALLMAKTTSLFRCLGKTIHGPGRLLARINTEIYETATRGMFVTMVGGIYDPGTGTVVLANAGHQPPLLHRRDGSFEAFPAEAPPLGILRSIHPDDFVREARVALDGGTLYVFSDGITEGFLKDGTTLRVEGLTDILRRQAGMATSDRIGAVSAVFADAGRPLRDDITLLAIDDRNVVDARHESDTGRMQPALAEIEELLEITVPARADRLRMIRQMVSLAATCVGFSDEGASDLMLAVDEACQNIIRHGYRGDPNGQIRIRLTREGEELVVLLRDYAPPVDQDSVRPRDLADVRPGGLGTHLMRECVDDMRFLAPPADGGNLLRLAKRIR
jgi:sigma-B regulation protein RsbU (phosphoserine phosphatase)